MVVGRMFVEDGRVKDHRGGDRRGGGVSSASKKKVKRTGWHEGGVR